jgi:N-methylhydantoinase A
MPWRIGIDTGGTFTDIIAHRPESGEWIEKKVWSERRDPGKSLTSALASLEVPLGELEYVVYGTTIVTNALIEGAVANVALVATKGFGDVLEIARQRRDIIFQLKPLHRMPSIVARELCLEVNERCDVHGNNVKGVDQEEASLLFRQIKGKYEAVAICLFHSYLNSANEEEVARIARRTCEYVCVSHEISPEAREYERTLATVLNAALLPMMANFISSLKSTGVPDERLHRFHSAGGMVSPKTASKFPLLLAMSGPAAGVEAASDVAKSLGLSYAISFDMGGTSTDCSLIVKGQAELQMDGTIGRYRVRQPMVAVESIGAGGGSIVRLTDSGLQIGPDSAGADPGPACYGRGGTLPTVADALSILGYFGTGQSSDRPITIDRKKALYAFSGIAERLVLSPEDAALGTVRVASAVAARAIKRITMGRGVDARSCSLIAFGGCGPMFACLLAYDLGIRSVVVPFRSSGLSAFGCLSAEQRFTRQRTVNINEREFDSSVIEEILSKLDMVVVQELLAQNASGGGIRVDHVALMRFAGQSYEIEVPFSRPTVEQTLTQTFRETHEKTYGFSATEPWECVALRATAYGGTKGARFLRPERDRTAPGPTPIAEAYFSDMGWCEVPEYTRDVIDTHAKVPGPAFIVDELSTTLIPPGWTARSGYDQHICIEQSGE